MAATKNKRTRGSEDVGTSKKRTRVSDEGDQVESAVEFEVLQAYRTFEDAIGKDRAQITRTGDIHIAMNNLDRVDSLFSKLAGSKNNGLFAHDARAMVSISELAQISVRNLKFDDTRSLVKLDDVMNSCKKYMLTEYFKMNGITEHVTAQGDLEVNEEAREEEDGEDGEGETSATVNANNDEGFKKSVVRRTHLQQFASYNEFHQFNWFKMGSLFNNLSKNVLTVDHMLGPFSMQKKVRAPPVRRDRDTVGAVMTAEKVTQTSLNSTQQITTPEQVKRCFKVLAKKKGNQQISLFEFVINPFSFAKSVENLFYTSFLIKEGRIVLEEDSEGFPCIRIKENLPSDPRAKEIENQRRRDAHQNHIIFQMDMPTWRILIDKFDIKTAFID